MHTGDCTVLVHSSYVNYRENIIRETFNYAGYRVAKTSRTTNDIGGRSNGLGDMRDDYPGALTRVNKAHLLVCRNKPLHTIGC